MTKLTTSLFLVCFSFLVASSLAQPDYQVDALMDFYNSTNGPYWSKKSSWGKGLPCEKSWYGVGCDDEDNIIKLFLPNNKVIGFIPESFGQLSSLREVNLNYNSIFGSPPESLTNLTSLTVLNLYHNTLTGSFPEILFNVTSLQNIDFSSNSLAGQLPDKFDSLPNLYSLNLASNQFSGSIPPTILNHLSNCDINLGENQLTTFPWDKWIDSEALSNSTLNLYNNRISGTLSNKIFWSKEIFFNYNLLTGTLPELNITDGVPKTTALSFYSNQLSGNLPVSLTQATNLKDITVSYNPNMSGEIPVQFASMPHLETLSFYGTGLTCPKDNSEWESFKSRSYVSCPYEFSSYDGPSSFVRWYIVFYIGAILLIVTVAILFLFFAIRSSRNKVEVVA